MIKALIFDFDGVLVDSHSIINRLFTKIINEKLHLGITLDEFSAFPGMRFDKRLKNYVKKKKLNVSDEEIDRVIEEGRIEYFKKASIDVDLYPGVKELLHQLKDLNIKTAIGTNGSRRTVEKLLKQYGIIDYFSSIVTYDDVEHGKPNPEMFLKNAKEMNLTPEECIVVDDAIEGIEGAHAAGMKAIGITTTSPAEELKSADVIVKTIKDINQKLIQSL
jgi:HAD superfamily hydrolase (TIGR01509 family)